MTTAVSKLLPISIQAGVCPPTDATKSSTPHYTAADKIRFVKNRPQKLGGWTSITLNGTSLTGKVRSVYSSIVSGKVITLLGSNQRLFTLIGSDVINITPFSSSAVAIANSLDTHYDTLVSDPLTTTNGSNEVVVADADAAYYIAGDTYTLSGATAVGGIGTSELNKDHIVREVGSGTITIKTTSNATSDATGGGASVVRTSGLVTVNSTAHGQTAGARVKIANAAAFGGILTADINAEHLIRNIATNTFDVMTGGSATSSVTSGGGASTEYYVGIDAGLADVKSGQGYGMAKYGVGLYGTALVSDNSLQYPRIWFFDNFGDNIIGCAGEQTGVYQWAGNSTTAPTLVANAPTAVNYAFVSDNTLITLGAGGVPNKIFTSDQGDIEEWTASSTNAVFEDNIEGAGKLISHVNVDGVNLLFTNNQCYTFQRIQGSLLWDIAFKENIGIIAPMARVVVKGVAYWMGRDNFYRWRGGNVEVVPSNTSNETTLLKYVFEDINRGQQYKSFAWYNQRYDEIWFHYPSEGSNEVDRVARFHVSDLHWTPDTFDRLAAEYPTVNLQYPRLIDSSNNFFRHEIGNDAADSAMPWSLSSNLRDFGTDNVLTTGIVPDSVQAGDISFTMNAFSYPQSAAVKNTKQVTVSPTTEIIALDIDGRFAQYTWSGEALGQQFIMGDWLEPAQQSSRAE